MKKYLKLFISGLFCYCCIPHNNFGMHINDIRDTYNIMAKPYRHLSVIHGAALAESHLIGNYYQFGNIHEPDKGQWLAKSDGPIRLTHALWTLINNNFLPSNNPSYPAAHMSSSTIANIICYLEKTRSDYQKPDPYELEAIIVDEPSFRSSLNSIEKEKQNKNGNYRKEIKQLAETLESTTSSAEQRAIKKRIQQLKQERSRELSKYDTRRLFKKLSNERTKQKIENELSSLAQLTGQEQRKVKTKIRQLKNHLKTLSNTKISSDCNRVFEFAQAIIDADQSSSSFYPPNIAYGILQSFLYKTAINKNDLFTYYRILRDKLGEKIFTNPHIIDSLEWINSHFDQDSLDKIRNGLLTLQKDDPKNFINLARDEWYEKFLYTQIMDRFYRGTFPKKPEYTNVKFKEIVYPDCTETTIRFLCNTLFYNPEKGVFSIPSPQANLIDPQLYKFYQHEINKQAAAVNLPDVHQRWSKLLVNRPFITYKSMLYYSASGSSIVISPPEGVDGFVRLPKEMFQRINCDSSKEKITIDNHSYILVTDNSVELFKVAASLKNIIIALNEFLGIKLFNNDAFFDPDFNQAYFPKIAEYIKPFKMIKMKPEELKLLDKHDLSKTGLTLTGKHIELELLYNHAELTLHEKKSKQSPFTPLLIQALNTENSKQTKAQLMNMLTLVANCRDNMPSILRYKILFAFNLKDDEEKIGILKHIAQSKPIAQLTDHLQARILPTIAKIIASLPMRFDWLYQQKCIDSIDSQLLNHQHISPIIEKWKKIAYERLYNQTLEPDSVPVLFEALVRTGNSYSDGIKIANESLNQVAPIIHDPQTKLLLKENTLDLYDALAQKGYTKQNISDSV